VIFHQAAQPGVRGSWADGFRQYAVNNVLGTQRLLEAAAANGDGRFVYASSSSVYGNAARYPTREDDLPLPH
jgi:nucleoside-diphosphate-sugar epimerase